MSQNVTLNIAGNNYSLRADTPEKERLMRIAAEEVNEMFEMFDKNFSNASKEDKMAFVALQQASAKVVNRSMLAACEEEAKSLNEELRTYLKDVEK